jgi:stage V sporulation protein B
LRKQTFIQGAMILLAAGLVNRLLGFIPRIALPRMIGAEGVGLYQLVYPFMIVLITVIAGGLPLAVAKLVAEAQSREDAAAVRRIVRCAMTLSVSAGMVAAAACVSLAGWIAGDIMPDSRVHTAFLTMIPVLPLVAVSSVWRGYFQGKQNMIPTALSTTTETLIRIAFTLLLAGMLLPYGLEAAAAGAMAGVVIGEFAGLLVLWRQAAVERKLEKAETAPSETSVPSSADDRSIADDRSTYRSLLGIAVPVTGSRLIGSLSYLLESILTAKSLAVAGLAVSVATAQYGLLQGMVIPLLTLPGALTYSLAVSLVPSLSEAAARKDWGTIHKRLHQSLRLAVVTGAPFIVLMSLLAEPLCLLVYGDTSMADMLRWMAPIGIFLYMQSPLQAALQALDRPGTALFNTFAGAAVKLVLIVQLASRPEFGIHGAVIAICVNMALVTLLHWISVARLTGFRLNPLDFVKIGSAVVIMSGAAVWMWNWQLLPQNSANLLSACSLSTLVYLLLLILMGLIDRHDVARIPIIGRIFR